MLKAVTWAPFALSDREAIFDRIALNNPLAAIELDDEFRDKAELARRNPDAYRAGRLRGTRELIVRANYVMIYRVVANQLRILRVKHARQQWP
jgi:addiction module RelE/StbE family toxin